MRLGATTHSTKMTEPPERMDHHIRMKLRAAAFRAQRVYPGAVGQLISRELLAYEEFGIRLANDGIVMRAAADIMAAETPVTTSVA